MQSFTLHADCMYIYTIRRQRYIRGSTTSRRRRRTTRWKARPPTSPASCSRLKSSSSALYLYGVHTEGSLIRCSFLSLSLSPPGWNVRVQREGVAVLVERPRHGRPCSSGRRAQRLPQNSQSLDLMDRIPAAHEPVPAFSRCYLGKMPYRK